MSILPWAETGLRRLAASFEGLDDKHAAAAAGAKADWRGGGKRIGLAVIFSFGCRCADGEQDAHRGQIFRAGAAGQKPVMADAVEALGQDVDQEAADDLPVSSVMVL